MSTTDRQHLARIERATEAKRRADEQYRAALLAAVDGGKTYAQLAEGLDISRQAVRQAVERARRFLVRFDKQWHLTLAAED